MSTTVRFHPLEFVIGLLAGIPLVIAFGLSPSTLMLYELCDAAVNVFSHAKIRLPRGARTTAALRDRDADLHRVHHSSFQPETDSNFSAPGAGGTTRIECRERLCDTSRLRVRFASAV